MTTKVRWGVLSTAKIGLIKVLPAMQLGQLCEIAAISSRNLPQAEEAAAKLGIPKAYGSYEELIAAGHRWDHLAQWMMWAMGC